MSTTSIGRIAVLYLALVAACVAALVVGFTHLRREPPVETRAATGAPAVSPPASGARDEGSAALATAQAEANAVAAALAVSPRSPDTVRRGRAQDRDHGRIPRRQPLAHQPSHLRRGHAIRSRLQSEPAPNPKSKSYSSRPDLCPSYESALKSGGNSGACTRDGYAPFLHALDHARLAITLLRPRSWRLNRDNRQILLCQAASKGCNAEPVKAGTRCVENY